jgi:eukaryotic-like serine/threonine-protein kinase
MKKCPQCGREYDTSMSFCLDDGVELLYGPGSGEPQTAILHSTAAPGEARTQVQPHTTEPTSVFPSGAGDVPKPGKFDKRLLLAALAFAGILLGGFVGFRYFYAGNAGSINSIAVLPFQNVAGDPNADYLSDGLAESLIYRLSQLPGLKVSPASSVMRYKGREFDAGKIAGELGVQAVMAGRMVLRGDNLSISVELIDAANDKTIWGEHYERKMSDLLATQREIAAAITEKLQLKLTGAEKGLSKKYTNDNEAYQLYLKGRFQWNKRTIDSLKSAAEHYNQAIEKDPGFALAYSGLAETYVLFPNYEVASAVDSMPRAKAAALRALELDDSLAEAHTALGWYYFTYEFDFGAGEKGLRRAIELNPTYATAYQWLAELLAQTKRFDEARAASQRAQEIDPLSPIISFNSGWHHYLTRRYDEAINDYNRTISLYPDFAVAYAGLCWAYERKGDLIAAIPRCRKAAELGGSYEKAFLSMTLARGGQRGEAIRIVEELKAEAGRKYVPSIALAIAYIGLGDKEAALHHLEKEVAERGYWASTFSADPVLDEFRSEPRFKALLKKMNLPE